MPVLDRLKIYEQSIHLKMLGEKNSKHTQKKEEKIIKSRI